MSAALRRDYNDAQRMGLTSGIKLGPYEIASPLGAGGMGEVYRARDTRLDRTVAVKILPAHLSESPEARQRFDREARAISSLSHPNICHLYDIGQHEGISYLVMEYLEGETLGERLLKGRLPLEQVFRIGAEICHGLERAHRSGVIHRDLKPGNIMLTRSGAKLMDFGLAKVQAAPLGNLSASNTLATMSLPLTIEGTIVGTIQYMAYSSNESSLSEIYVVPFQTAPDGTPTISGGKWQVSNGGGIAPVWRRDGKELFFTHSSASTLMSASISIAGDHFQSDKPQSLFDVDAHPIVNYYTVTGDGQKIYMASYGPGSTAPFTVTTNWLDLVKK
jgi:serine/threonine protein kinase